MHETTPKMSDQEKLEALTAEYFSIVGKGCLVGLADAASGRHMRRKWEIAKILGTTTQAVDGVFISVRSASLSGSKEAAAENLKLALMIVTHGGQSTGDPGEDAHIKRMAVFTKMVLDEHWKIKGNDTR